MIGSYFLRYALTVARTRTSRKTANIFDELTMPMRIWPTDIDLMGHLNNGRLLTLLDIARLDFAIRTGIGAAGVQNRWIPLVAGAVAAYKRPLKAGQLCDVTTRISHFNEKWFYIEHRLEVDQQVYMAATLKSVLKTSKGQTVSASDFLKAMGMEDFDKSLLPPPSAFTQAYINSQHEIDNFKGESLDWRSS